MATESPQTPQPKSPPSMKRALIPVFVILALGVLVPGALKWVLERGQGGATHSHLEVGAVIPDFSAPKLGGGTLKKSELSAKILLVNFWATWCEACIVEMPSIVALHADFKDRGFEVLAVNLDETLDGVAPLAKKLGMNFPIALDPEGKLGELFNVSAIPLTVILDQEGRVLASHKGERDWNSASFRKQLEGWLAGK